MNNKLYRFLLILLILANLTLAACGGQAATETPVPTPPAADQATKPSEDGSAPAADTEKPADTPTDEPVDKPEQPADEPAAEPSTEPPSEPAATVRPDDELAMRLQGLDIDAFFELSWRELAMRDPEWVLSEGLGSDYALPTVELTNISDAYQRETIAMHATVLQLLLRYDQAELTPEQQISFDVYRWYLEDVLRDAEFMYYDYPVTYFPVTAVHEQTIQFFTDLHPLATVQDAEDYVTRLEQVDTKFDQLFEGLALREEAGIMPPGFASQWALYTTVYDMAGADPTDTPFYETLEEKLDELPELDNSQRDELLQAAEQAIQDSVIPAFEKLRDRLEEMQSQGANFDGLWQFEGGDAYYNYLLKHYTTTDLTAEQIHELGLQELERIHAEMRVIFDQLGYPQDESLTRLFNRVAEDGGSVSGNQVLDTYRELIEQADQRLDPLFDIRPQAEIAVVGTEYGGYYMSAARDGSRPGTFYAGLSGSEERYGMATLAYHEAIPGHHFQISLAQEVDLPIFRGMVGFLGYTEGWALYAEQLAYEQGWYDDDPYGNLGRLQAEAFRAARLVVDTGIHAKKWTFDEATAFFSENVGLDDGDSINARNEIARYIVWPGQSTAYKIGMLKILELRQRAMDQLGDQFDTQEFHNVVLTNGSMPLEVLEQVIDHYIQNKLTNAQAPAAEAASNDSNKILLVFGNRFIGYIYRTIRPMFEEQNYQITVASRTASSMQAKNEQLEVTPDLLLEEVNVADYAAIIFVCDNDIAFGSAMEQTNRIVQEAVAQNKVLGAICASPMILGFANVVEGLTVTGEPSNTCSYLESLGATCTGRAVEQDGHIITAKDRYASTAFANAILQTLAGG